MTVIRALAGLVCVLLLAPSAASAVTIDQIVALSKAGVSDAVIVALIGRDHSVFTLEPAQLAELQQAGVTEPVTVAMLENGGAREPLADTVPAQPGVVVYAVPAQTRRPHGVVAPPAVRAAQAVSSTRGIFFANPSTGIFFPPPAAADCPTPAARPHRQ